MGDYNGMEDFTLHLIESITDKFSDDRIVGSGGYGDVYKAEHKGKEIAVKKLHPFQGLDDKQFHNEVRNLINIRHKNVVQLIGYCYESRNKYIEHNKDIVFARTTERVICFEYMEGGSLDKHIADAPCGLGWSTCYDIIKGTCDGLNHLHSVQAKPIYHLDLKPGNILLDKSMMPKIGDLGLSKLVASTETHKTEMLKGTNGYMPPEYIDGGHISKKFDVFSLGVIILRMMAGNKGYFRCSKTPPKHFIDLVSENWKERLQAVSQDSSYEMDILRVRKCVEIALKCVDTDRKKRPTIQDIVREVEELEADIEKMMSTPSPESKDLTVQRSCDTNVLSVDPTLELRFVLEARKETSCCLQLINKTDSFIAFNVKINQHKYRVRPSQGTMRPCSWRYVIVTLQKQEPELLNMRCRDMLFVQSISVTQDLASKDGDIDYQELFEKPKPDKVVDVLKLPIVYVTLDQ
ncbi:hypothetical protein ACQJBY_019961 [Aegilops geniculata]